MANTKKKNVFFENKNDTFSQNFPKRKNIFLNIELKQRGLSKDGSWKISPHEKYLLTAKDYNSPIFKTEINAIFTKNKFTVHFIFINGIFPILSDFSNSFGR
ncbi:hypothetical protein IX38_13240 [Chryseobacterium luteum]|uniref:Uncharacterized protein n=1 Tax=Chryseobacterium luteum TaxID=421531 RepID=A0A085ZDP6_9FLAO|nr:hypothetical protein IX38_13240 [Chryseobacterium luteum]